MINGNGAYASGKQTTEYGIKYYQSAVDEFAKQFAGLMNKLNGGNESDDRLMFTSADGSPDVYKRQALFPIISFAHRRLSSVSGTKTKCRWGVVSSMCTTADTIFSFPTRPIKKSAALWKNSCISFGEMCIRDSRNGIGNRLQLYHHSAQRLLTGCTQDMRRVRHYDGLRRGNGTLPQGWD